jgi:hypothetical protein
MKVKQNLVVAILTQLYHLPWLVLNGCHSMELKPMADIVAPVVSYKIIDITLTSIRVNLISHPQSE